MENTKLRFKFKKLKEFKYLSHLETVRLMLIGIRRAGLNMRYSEGFNPNPRINFSFPIPVGLASFAEYSDVELIDTIEPQVFQDLVNKQLKDEFCIIKTLKLNNKLPSLMEDIAVVKYKFILSSYDKKNMTNMINLLTSLANNIGSIFLMNFNDVQFNKSNIVYLNLFGYTKVLKNNEIFKFKDFLINLKDISNNNYTEVKDFFKEEAYVIRENILKTPLDIV